MNQCPRHTLAHMKQTKPTSPRLPLERATCRADANLGSICVSPSAHQAIDRGAPPLVLQAAGP
jgi:hypothetical protein